MVTGKYHKRLEKMNQQGFVDAFHQRVIKRFEINFEGPVLDMQFLYTQKYRAHDDQVGFYLILLLKETSFELIDISGKSVGVLETGIRFKRVIGNAHNDDYYFIGLDQEEKLHLFTFQMRFSRASRGAAAQPRVSNLTSSKRQQPRAAIPRGFRCFINRTSVYEPLPEQYQAHTITAMLPYLTRGVKYTILGDSAGNVQ